MRVRCETTLRPEGFTRSYRHDSEQVLLQCIRGQWELLPPPSMASPSWHWHDSDHQQMLVALKRLLTRGTGAESIPGSFGLSSGELAWVDESEQALVLRSIDGELWRISTPVVIALCADLLALAEGTAAADLPSAPTVLMAREGVRSIAETLRTPRPLH